MNNKYKILIIILLIVAGGIIFFAINKNKNQKEIEPIVNELPLKIDSTPLKFNIVKNQSGQVLEARFTNNSKEDISRLVLVVKLKDTGEVIELKCNTPVEVGKTSEIFKGKAPESGKLEDIEVLKYKISTRNGVYMEYDEKSKQYNWS